MAKAVKSSLFENRSPEVFRGLSWYAVKAALGGLIAGGMAASIFKNIPFLPVVFIIGTPIGCFLVAQKLISGNYEFEGWEKLFGKIKSIFSGKIVDLEEEAGFSRNDRDESSVIRGDNLNEIECFEITEISAARILGEYRYLLKNLPEGFKTWFVRTSLDHQTDRKCLKKAKLFKCYVFLEYKEGSFGIRGFRAEARKILSPIGRLLSAQETHQAIKEMIQPGIEDFPFEQGKLLREIGLDVSWEMAHFGEISKRAITLTLAELPQMVGEDFQKLFGVMNSYAGSISVSFTGQGNGNVLADFFYEKTLKSLGKTREDPGELSRANLAMSIGAIIHGSEQELGEMMEDLKREYSFLDHKEQPKFKREGHFLKESILLMLPGQGPVMDFRKKHIANMDEALFYIPLVRDSGGRTSFLTVRTEFNSIYNLSLSYSHPLYIWAGVGKGKSALLSLFLLTHVKKEQSASFSLEAGGTFSFLRDGISEVNVILEQDKQGRWLPLEDHPIRFFLSYGESGIEAASDWLWEIAEIIDEGGEIRRIIHTTICQMRDESLFRLKDFCRVFADRLKSENVAGPDSKNAIKNIAAFASTKESLYGNIFDPEETKSIDYEKARHFYVSQTEATKEAPRLLAAFFSYGLHMLKAIEKRFAAGGADPRDLLVTIDEINHLVKEQYIGWQDLRDLNSQGRKQGKLINCASQSLSDAIAADSKRPYEFIESFGHFLFASGVSDIDHLIRAIGLADSDREKAMRKDFQLLVDTIDTIRRREKGYAWGYIDQHKEFKILLFDLEKHEEWAVTSHKAARMLRSEVIKVNECSYLEACRLLALFGPQKLPVSEPMADAQKLMMFAQMRKHGGRDEISR